MKEELNTKIQNRNYCLIFIYFPFNNVDCFTLKKKMKKFAHKRIVIWIYTIFSLYNVNSQLNN